MPSVNIIGAGRVGKTLGRLLFDYQLATIQHIYNRSLASGKAAAEFITEGKAVASLADLQPSDITLITSTDDSIQAVCEALAAADKIKSDSMVLHCSGALGSDVLHAAKAKGAFVASMHPLKSFADSEQAIKSMPGTGFAIEGDEQVVSIITSWLQAWGATLLAISSEHKTQYHAASVLACSGLTSLYGTVMELYQASGMSEAQAQTALAAFMQETLDNNKALGAEKALTGPVARGDEAVIKKHEKVLGEYDSVAENLYKAITEKAKKL